VSTLHRGDLLNLGEFLFEVNLVEEGSGRILSVLQGTHPINFRIEQLDHSSMMVPRPNEDGFYAVTGCGSRTEGDRQITTIRLRRADEDRATAELPTFLHGDLLIRARQASLVRGQAGSIVHDDPHWEYEIDGDDVPGPRVYPFDTIAKVAEAAVAIAGSGDL
jgi:hypothetical protein